MTRGGRVEETFRKKHCLVLRLIVSDSRSMMIITVASTTREDRHNFEDLVSTARTLEAVVALYHLLAFLATHATINLSIVSRL